MGHRPFRRGRAVVQGVTVWVDGNNIGWRALHAGQDLSYRGQATGMLALFLHILRASLDTIGEVLRVERTVVCWDAGIPEFRRRIYPSYKAGRNGLRTSEEARENRQRFDAQQEILATELLPPLGVGQRYAQGWEADDVIASGIAEAREMVPQSLHVIVSGDRDVWQLVGQQVAVLSPTEGWVTRKNLQQVTKGMKTGQEWLWYRILTGDASDSIRGIGKVGPVRARELLVHARTLLASAVDDDPAVYEFDVPLLRGKGDTIWRNRQLMDLGVAVWRMREAGVSVQRIEGEWSPGAAEAALLRYGMTSIVTNWLEWARPLAPPGATLVAPIDLSV